MRILAAVLIVAGVLPCVRMTTTDDPPSTQTSLSSSRTSSTQDDEPSSSKAPSPSTSIQPSSSSPSSSPSPSPSSSPSPPPSPTSSAASSSIPSPTSSVLNTSPTASSSLTTAAPSTDRSLGVGPLPRSICGYYTSSGDPDIKTRSCDFGTTCGIASPNFPGLLACHTTVYTECVVKKVFDPCPSVANPSETAHPLCCQEKDGATPVCRTYIGPRSNNPIALKMYVCEPTSLGHETNVFLYQETAYLLPQTRSSGQTTGLTANNLSSMTVSDASTSGMTSTTGPLSTSTSTATPAATSDVPSTPAQTPVIVGGVIGGLVILGFVVCFVVWVRTRKPPAVSGPTELPADQPVEHAGCELDAGGHRGRRREEDFLMPESPVIRHFGNDDFHSVRQRSDLSP